MSPPVQEQWPYANEDRIEWRSRGALGFHPYDDSVENGLLLFENGVAVLIACDRGFQLE